MRWQILIFVSTNFADSIAMVQTYFFLRENSFKLRNSKEWHAKDFSYELAGIKPRYIFITKANFAKGPLVNVKPAELVILRLCNSKSTPLSGHVEAELRHGTNRGGEQAPLIKPRSFLHLRSHNWRDQARMVPVAIICCTRNQTWWSPHFSTLPRDCVYVRV